MFACLQWHSLSREDQQKYYEMARKERQIHMQMFPGWSARDNYVSRYERLVVFDLSALYYFLARCAVYEMIKKYLVDFQALFLRDNPSMLCSWIRLWNPSLARSRACLVVERPRMFNSNQPQASSPPRNVGLSQSPRVCLRNVPRHAIRAEIATAAVVDRVQLLLTTK